MIFERVRVIYMTLLTSISPCFSHLNRYPYNQKGRVTQTSLILIYAIHIHILYRYTCITHKYMYIQRDGELRNKYYYAKDKLK